MLKDTTSRGLCVRVGTYGMLLAAACVDESDHHALMRRRRVLLREPERYRSGYRTHAGTHDLMHHLRVAGARDSENSTRLGRVTT